MGAFYGDPKLKRLYKVRLYVQRTYWSDIHQCGCAIGAIVRKDNPEGKSPREEYSVTLGIPVHIVDLIDNIYEGLPLPSARKFALASYDAMEPGDDLSSVPTKMVLYILELLKEAIAKDSLLNISIFSRMLLEDIHACKSMVRKIDNGTKLSEKDLRFYKEEKTKISALTYQDNIKLSYLYRTLSYIYIQYLEEGGKTESFPAAFLITQALDFFIYPHHDVDRKITFALYERIAQRFINLLKESPMEA